MLNAAFNHLWQSTAFTAVVALAAWMLRRNSPRTRYWLWLAASLKYLIPFSLLVSAGIHVQLPPDTPSLHAVTVQRISNSFAPLPASPALPSMPAAFNWTSLLAAIWLAGALFRLARWHWQWRALRRIMRDAHAVPHLYPIPTLWSSAAPEPGVFGILRPVLVLPEGLAQNLTPERFEAVIAHELRHIRCHDNLTAALHLCVESIFWFHPLVWRIGARLMDERERDCDEAVLSKGAAPAEYARGILRVCQSCVALPGSCAAGICGYELRKRILEIMTWRPPIPTSSRVKAALATSAILAVAIPLIIGILRAQRLPPEPAWKYGVVSIHKSAPEADGSQWEAGPQGGLRTLNTTTLELLEWAYQIPDYRLSGAPMGVNGTL